MRDRIILAAVLASLAQAGGGGAASAQAGAGAAAVEGDRYRSYVAAADAGGGFEGSVAGGYSVEQLMGRDVVGPDGNEIARVSDLLVEPDDRIRKVIVDVGGFLGIGARPVALDVAELRRRGDGGDLHTSLTGEQLLALPRYERDGEGRYYVQDRGG